MENIDKTVKSKYPPKQKNVNWIDTSGDKPVMKVFNNGRWSNINGSGNSSNVSSGIKYNEIPLTPFRQVLSLDDEYPLIQEEVSETYPGYNFNTGIIDLVNGVIPETLYLGNLEGSPMIINAYRMSGIKVFDIDRNIKMYSYAGYNGSYILLALSNDGSKLYYVDSVTIGPVTPSNPGDSEQSK